MRIRLERICQPITEQVNGSLTDVYLLENEALPRPYVQGKFCDWWSSPLHLDLLTKLLQTVFTNIILITLLLLGHSANVLSMSYVKINGLRKKHNPTTAGGDTWKYNRWSNAYTPRLR